MSLFTNLNVTTEELISEKDLTQQDIKTEINYSKR